MDYAPQQYNLDAIFSVGYRVNSLRATQLRRWSTGVLRERANAAQPHMGLTSWDKAPDGKIVKTDVVIAKNCLSRDERASPPASSTPPSTWPRIWRNARFPTYFPQVARRICA